MIALLTNKYVWFAVAAMALAAAAVVFVQRHDAAIATSNYSAGYNARVAEEAQSAATAKALADGLDQMAALATHNFHARLATDLPQIEATTHARTDQIKIIYRDHPVPGACVRPAGVLQQLEAARTAANAAATAAAH